MMEKANESRTLYVTIRNRQTVLLGQIMKKEALYNIGTIGKLSSSRGKKNVTEK